MMLGWGLRGFIGGGPFGAMIPGTMVALAILLFHPRRDAALFAAFASIGVGFGGEMTYGQTVGFSVKAETFWFGIGGLALKGGIWGALAGAVLAVALDLRPRVVAGASAVMIAATGLGWKLINEPKLLYFSHPIDKPRPEIWAGFLLAAVAVGAWLHWNGRPRPVWRFIIAGFVGGFIGFGGGGAIQGLGRIFTPELNLHWWKYMEFFFGFCFGWALAWAFGRVPDDVADDVPPTSPSVGVQLVAGAIVTAALMAAAWHLPLRYSYLVSGAILLVAVFRYRQLAPAVAYTIPATAFFLDLARYWSREYKHGPEEPAYAVAVVASILFGWWMLRERLEPAEALRRFTIVAVVDAVIKFAIHPNGIVNVIDHVCIGFILMAAAILAILRRCRVTGFC